MDFLSAEKERARLLSQLTGGQITRDAYVAAVNALRVTDPSGRWWQPDPSGSGWLVWNGSAWSPASPPTSTGGLQPGTPKTFIEFKNQLMTVEEFKKMSKEVPLAKRPQKWWDLLSILGACVSATLWLLYSGNPWGEGIDLITAALMVGLPVLMIWFRADLDVALLALQQYRKNVNKFLLVGMGMAFPFLSSFILFTVGIREYQLMQSNMIIGALGAYAITRNPVISLPGTGSTQGSGRPPVAVTNAFFAIILAVICYFLVLPVRADDCTRNLLNANDCDRTPGYAQVISGTPPAVIAGLVNGRGIHETLTIGGSGGGQPPAPPAQPPTTAPGSSTTATSSATSSTTSSATQGASSATTGQPPVAGGDAPSLPITSDDVQNVKEAVEDTHAENLRLAAEEAAAAIAAQAAARAAAEQAARDNLLQKLQHMNDGMVEGSFASRFTADDYERISNQIDKVSDQLRNGGKVDLDLYSKIYRVYEGRVTGRTIPAGEIPSEAQIFRETITGGLEGTSREIFTGQNANGDFSYKSLALRGLVGVATGGSSELAYTPASSVYTMKDYVDKGGDSVLGAFGHALKDVAIGELMGHGITGLTKYGGKLVNAAVDSLPTNLTTPVKEGLEEIKNVLNTEIKNPFAGEAPGGFPEGGLAGTKPALQSPADIGEQIYRDAQAGQPHAGLDDVSFKPADAPVNTAAYSPEEQKAIRFVAEQNGAEVHFRDVNEYSVKRIQSGDAYSKPAELKSNTVNDADVALGFSDEHKGLVSCREPVLPERGSMTDAEWGKLNERYEQRMTDFNDNAAHLQELEAQQKIKWDRETGLITNGPDGKPFAGDHDVLAYTDAYSHKPISPFTANRMNQQLQDLNVTNHNHQTDWNFSNLSDTPPTSGGASPFSKAAGVDSRVLNGCTEGGKPLETFNPLSGKWESNWYTGSTQRNFVQTAVVDGKTVVSKIAPGGT
jgi:hypothetical protein